MSLRTIILALACVASLSGPLYAQRTIEPKFYVGGRAGVTLSRFSFTPSVDQSMLTGFTAGAVFRYTEEKCVGILGEINIAQRGWAESYEPGENWKYSRRLTYIDIPVMTHIFFGPKKFKCFINLGPEVAFLLGSSINSNFDYNNPKGIGYPPNRQTDELSHEITGKIDYGITGGIGCEWRMNERHSVMIEARYYFGLGNIFPSSKKDTFSASRGSSIEVTAGYLFRVK